MTTVGAFAKVQKEGGVTRYRSKEHVKAPLKELRDIMNMTKAKMPLGEISHFADLGPLMPRTTTGFMAPQHLNLIPQGPHKVLARREANPKKENSFENSKNIEGNMKGSEQDENQSKPSLKKKNLSIRVAENSPKSQPIKLVQFKSLSTKHANEPKVDREIAAAIPLQPASSISIPNYEPAKCSLKRNGIVAAYAANTNQGLVRYELYAALRNYNEDRVSIILNIIKPATRASENWPKCSFFGIYDGHGGSACADYLRDNLHQFVIRESSFPWNPREALKKGFEAAEAKFLKACQGEEKALDRSGSCAVVALIVGDMCYVANVGDSRAVLSG